MLRAVRLTLLGLSFLSASFLSAQAVIRPFVDGGGLSSRAEKQGIDEMTDSYTIHQSSTAWELGGGVRLFSPTLADPKQGERIGIRLRFALGGGGFPDESASEMRTDFSYRHRYAVRYRDSFDYNHWAFGAFFSARVMPRGGFFLGPVLQTVKYESKRSWTGPTDCYLCGPGDEQATVRYGALEGGLHYRPFAQPLRLEAYWVPARAELSKTQIVKSSNYTPEFSSFKQSIGARLSYEF